MLILLDTANKTHLMQPGQAERQTRFASAAGATDAVHIHLGVWRGVDIDDGFELRDVQPARCQVGGHQHRAAAVGKLCQHQVPLALFEIARQCQGTKALLLQAAKQFPALLPGVAKRQGADRPKVHEQLGHCGQTLVLSHLVEALFNRALGWCALDLDVPWLTHEFGGQLANTLGVGGRKKQGLAGLRALLDDGGYILKKSHVEHAVGLVEHQRVECVKCQVAPRQMVHDAPGRAHRDMGALFQRGTLSAQGHAAAQAKDLDVAGGTGQAAQLGAHLVSEFPGRAQHQGLHGKAAGVQAGKCCQAKGCGFATACLRLGNQVLPGQSRRQAGGLNRRHLVVTELRQIGQNGGLQQQAGKAVLPCRAGPRDGGGAGSALGYCLG